MDKNAQLELVKNAIGCYPDFPKKGIVFRDIFSALTDGEVCKHLKQLLVNLVREKYPQVELIVGLESRGFLFNLMIAAELGVGCAPIRKKGKLPGKCVSIEYTLEYGKDTFEMQVSAIKAGQKVLIIDDLLATGGSMAAAIELVQKTGANLLGTVVVMELIELAGRKKFNCDVHSLIQY